MNTSELLAVHSVSKSYSKKRVLNSVSLTLKKGELVSLLGVSGAGKTTLFNIISGLDTPDSGCVVLGGKDITGCAGHISYMLQKDMLLPWYTVLDNTALPLVIRGMSRKDARIKASSYFAQFGLAGTEKQYPKELSGGMKQRAALLRTYLFSDTVALLDEPFSALDMITKRQMHGWYLSIMEQIRLSTLFITHDIDEAILLSDRICILGGTPASIIKEIEISEPKPRNPDFTLTPQFIEYKMNILKLLSDPVISSSSKERYP